MSSKFKVLDLNELTMVRLRIYTRPLTDSVSDFFESITVYYISFNMVAFIATSMTFAYQNLSDFFMFALRTAMVVVGTSQAFGMFLCLGYKIIKVKMIHQKLQAIVDQAASDGHTKIIQMYRLTEQKCRKFTKFYLYYICCNQSSFVAALTFAIYCICIGNRNTSTWILPFSLVVPFNTEPLWGWFLHWYFQFSASLSYTLCMIIPTTYFASFCRYIAAICNHIEILIDSIRYDVEQIHSDAKGEQTVKMSTNFWPNVHSRIIETIDLHVKAMDIFDLVADVNSGAIFSLLPINGMLLALSMYTIENSEFYLVVFFFDMLCLICALMWCSLFCYFANMASDRLSSIGDKAFATNWYDYPVEWQNHFILMIVRSQKPVHFKGLNLINCTLEVFGKLCKSSCSYYVGFRSLSQM